MNINRMILRLYAYPILLLIGSFLAMYILGSFISNQLSQTSLFLGIGDQTKSFAPTVGLILLGASLLWGLFSSFELWQWFNGRGGETCHNCGGMTVYHPNGRYGPYFKCMACGKNRVDR